MRKLLILAAILIVIGVATAAALYKLYPVQMAQYAGMARNLYLTLSAPQGTVTTELNAANKGVGAAAPPPSAEASLPDPTSADWPSYNRTLTSDRYSQLSQINTKNVGKLKILCTYDTNQHTGFESGLIMVNDALIGTTQFDIFSLDPATCAENWRTHEDYPPSMTGVNRGAAYLDGRLFRGTQDGRVLAYDFKTGKRLWADDDRGPEKGRVGAGRADRLERPRVRRQCRRRLQGREGAHVRAGCQDRQDRLGILSGALKPRATQFADPQGRRR